MLVFVKMIFRVRLYGVSRHEDGAKRNPNGQCGGTVSITNSLVVSNFLLQYISQDLYGIFCKQKRLCGQNAKVSRHNILLKARVSSIVVYVL